MLTNDPKAVEVRCPTCNAAVKVSAKEAETKMKVKCPKGHDVELVRALS